MINDYFDEIFVINLTERSDRRQEVSAQLSRLGLSLNTPGIALFPAVRPTDMAGFPSIGSRGCYLSHLGILKEALSRGLKRILILEDDLDFSPDFVNDWTLFFPHLQAQPWSIFYAGYVLPQGGNIGGVVLPTQGIQTTHFVAFQGDVLQTLVDYLEAILLRAPGHPDGGPMHVDGAYSRFRADHPEFMTLAADPQLGFQRVSRSDIAALKWFDRVGFLSSTVGLARRFKRLLYRWIKGVS